MTPPSDPLRDDGGDGPAEDDARRRADRLVSARTVAAALVPPLGAPVPPTPPRKRPKPGERRVQILQTLATMLEEPGAERVTTAALAAKLEVSEAALYRHFASKAQMFEGLIEFIEQSVFALVNQVAEREPDAAQQARRMLGVLRSDFLAAGWQRRSWPCRPVGFGRRAWTR